MTTNTVTPNRMQEAINRIATLTSDRNRWEELARKYQVERDALATMSKDLILEIEDRDGEGSDYLRTDPWKGIDTNPWKITEAERRQLGLGRFR